MSELIWKQVPPPLVYGYENVYASTKGDVTINGFPIIGTKGAYGKYGRYRIANLNGKTLYFHRLIYFAHSDKTVEELKAGRVIFKNTTDASSIITDEGIYRCWFEDLMFEPSTFITTENIITHTECVEHSVYGSIELGIWMPVYSFDKVKRIAIKSTLYEICFLNNTETPCLIRNKARNSLVKYHFHDNHDGYVSLKHADKTLSYLLSHIMLASAFPTIPLLKTVDHIDDNPKNHYLLNLQWLSTADNSRKGQPLSQKTCVKPKEVLLIEGEIWKPLPINERTLTDYCVSNRGRVKRNKTNTIISGCRLRGKKYMYCTITTATNVHTKYYIHHLVYITFHGPIPDTLIILHDDSAPLTEEGVYRNWAEDLRSGSKRENNIEHHEARRA